MTKYVIDRFTTEFMTTLATKNSWGKDEIVKLFFTSLSDVLLDVIDNEEDLKKDNSRIS